MTSTHATTETGLTTHHEGGAVALTPDAMAEFEADAAAEVAPNTRRAYAADWRVFATWCERNSYSPLPADAGVVLAFLDHEERVSGRAWSTVSRRVSAIRAAHRAAGLDAPLPFETFKRWRKARQTRRANAGHSNAADGARPITAAEVVALCEATGADLAGARDRALFLATFALGWRMASEVATLRASDLTWTRKGVVINLRRSKTDQTGQGRSLALHAGRPGSCPVDALRSLVNATGAAGDDPVFPSVDRWGNVGARPLTRQAVAGVLARAADAAEVEGVSPHSFRAGHVTTRRANGEDAASIMDATGHRSVAMIRHYDRGAKVDRHNLTAAVGL